MPRTPPMDIRVVRVRFWLWLALKAVRRANRLDHHPDGMPTYSLLVPAEDKE